MSRIRKGPRFVRGPSHHINHMQEHCASMIPRCGPIRMVHGDQASSIQSDRSTAATTSTMAPIVK